MVDRYSTSGPMEEAQLLALLNEEERDASSYYDSEFAIDQAEAMERYFAQPYGDEVEGRSQVVTHDIEDCINWMMPHLMRLFLNNDELVTVEDETSDDIEEGEIAGAYLNSIFFKDNKGEEILHDFAFDGLLQRVGIVRVAWEDPQPEPPKQLKNVPLEKVAQYLEDPSYEIIGQATEDEITFDLEIVYTPPNGKCIVEAVPPEEFAWSKLSKSPEDADYHRRKSDEFLGDLIDLFPDKADDLMVPGNPSSNARGDDDLDSDPRTLARFQDETDDPSSTEAYHERRKKVELLTEYVRVDYDGDGTVELRQIKRVGDVILENIEVQESEFVVWSPVRVAHRLAGRSLADMMVDIQKIRTVLTRKLLDGLSQSLAPQRAVNTRTMDENAIDQLLDHEIGGVIEVSGPPGESIMDLTTPDVSQSAYAALEYFDQRSEEASGVTRHSQGLRPEAITDTAQGIRDLQAAANARIELIGRWLAIGAERIFQRMFRLVQAHQDQPVVRRLQGRRQELQPSLWSENSRVSIHIGTAAEPSETKLAKLNIIASKQEQILLQAGPGNPIVGLKEYRDTLALMAREAGFKKPERFFKEIDEEQLAAQMAQEAEQPDPEVLKAQAEAKLKEQEAQANAAREDAKAQHAAQLETMKAQAAQALEEARAQAAQAAQAAKIEADRELAAIKAENERTLQAVKLEGEREIAILRIQNERDLAFARMQMEAELARERAKREAETAEKMDQNRPGGRLDA